MRRKNTIRLTESAINRIITESMRKVIKESAGNPLSPEEILQLAQIVVNKYGNGNCIDLDNPDAIVSDVKYVMRTQGCDEYEALVYMSGAKGGGWG